MEVFEPSVCCTVRYLARERERESKKERERGTMCVFVIELERDDVCLGQTKLESYQGMQYTNADKHTHTHTLSLN